MNTEYFLFEAIWEVDKTIGGLEHSLVCVHTFDKEGTAELLEEFKELRGDLAVLKKKYLNKYLERNAKANSAKKKKR